MGHLAGSMSAAVIDINTGNRAAKPREDNYLATLLRRLAIEAERGDIRSASIIIVRPTGTVETLGDVPELTGHWRK